MNSPGAGDTLGSATGSTTSCPTSQVGIGGTCYKVTVTCPDVDPINPLVKVTSPSGTSKGTVVMMVGGGADALYEDPAIFTYGSVTVNTLVQAGFTTAQIAFETPPAGFLTGPGGPRKLACRPATLSQWIHDNVAPPSTAFCGTGNSGGSGALAYALGHYNLSQTFDMVELTSGPVFSRIDHGCECNQAPLTSSCSGSVTECYGTNAQMFIDPAYTNSDCSNAETTHDTANSTLWLNDSLLSSDATLSFPHTTVHFVFGGQDNGSGVAQGLDWMPLITAKGAVTAACVADAPHPIPNVLDGAQQIANDLIAMCHQ